MIFLSITIKNGLFERKVHFSNNVNLIHSIKNATGKTTFIRAMLYAMGYPIPSTKGLNFDIMEFELIMKCKKIIYTLYRRNSYMQIKYNENVNEYSLPTDLDKVITLLTGCKNKDILHNLLGIFYVDQEKGWTLLNRGKVIGSIHFNIESLVRGLGNKDCSKELQQLEAVKQEKRKYEYMQSVKKYQDEINAEMNNIVYDYEEDEDEKMIEILKAEQKVILNEMNQIKRIISGNKLLSNYITEMKLVVRGTDGEEILVTRNNLVGFEDNMQILETRRKMLSSELRKNNLDIDRLEKKKVKANEIFNVQTVIEKFDFNIKKIQIDAITIQRIIEQLEKQKGELQKRIKNITKSADLVIVALHTSINKYAQELGISNKYVAANHDYIFTNDLKSLSGTILHKIVFSFKLSYIHMVEKITGISLPIILDSPSGREVEPSTIEEMLKILQRDFSNHQIIIASINNYDLENKQLIEFRNALFEF